MAGHLPSPQPHDALVKFTFSQREHAIGLLKASLPAGAGALIQWSTLALERIDFVDRGLRRRHADLLYSMRARGGAPLYVHALVEQQRDVERLMIFRFNVYMTRIWERLVRDEPKRTSLPPIVPILIHHSERGWSAATAFEDIIEVSGALRAALVPHIPHFRMKLCDVSPGKESGLASHVLTDLGRVVLWALSVAHDDARFEAELEQLVTELNALFAKPNAIDAVLAVLRYLIATHVKMGGPKVVNLLERAAKKGRKEVHVDVLDELKREGRAEGLAEGLAKGKREGLAKGKREGLVSLLLKQLAARFGPVPAEVKTKVLAAKEATLERWSIRVLTAPTLDAVLNGRSPIAAKKARR